MNTKMNEKRRWMVGGLFVMCMMGQCVWAQEGETVKKQRPADPFVKGAKPASGLVQSASVPEPTAASDNKEVEPSEERQEQELRRNAEVKVSLVFFPKEFIEERSRKPSSPTEEDLVKAWREGKGRLVASHLMVSKLGHEVAIKGEGKHFYPTEFNVVADGGSAIIKVVDEKVAEKLGKQATPYLKKTGDMEKGTGDTTGQYRAVAPGNFVVHNTGFLTRIMVDSPADSKILYLYVDLDYCARAEDREAGTVQSGLDEKCMRMVQPDIRSMSIATPTICSDGHTTVQGGMRSSDGKEVGYFFITPRITKFSEAAQPKKNEKKSRNIELQQLLVCFPKTLIETFARESGAAAASPEQIIKAWRDGKGRLASSVLSICPSSTPDKTACKNVQKDIYPSEIRVSGGSLRNGDVLWKVEPQNMVMCETGFTSESFMAFQDDTDIIVMTVSPQYVSRGTDRKIDIAWSSGGKQQQVVLPEFYTQSSEFVGFAQSGQTTVTGGMLSADGQEMGYFLVTPRIVESQK